MLSKEEARLYERYKEIPDSFSTASITDAAARRQTKIERFKEEKALKEKLEVSGGELHYDFYYERRKLIRLLFDSISNATLQPLPPMTPHCAHYTSQTSHSAHIAPLPISSQLRKN